MQYLTEKEVAERYKVTVKTVQKWRRLGVGPPYSRIASRTIRYAVSDLIDYDKRNTVQSESQNRIGKKKAS